VDPDAGAYAVKRMREAKTVEEKMTLLDELQRILKESKEVLDEIHKKQSG
jgi:hypothetical protein